MSTVTLSKPHCAITSAEKPDGIASQAFTTALPEAQTFFTLFAIACVSLCDLLFGGRNSLKRRPLSPLSYRQARARHACVACRSSTDLGMAAEIGGANGFVAPQFVGLAAEHDAAGFQHVAVIGHRKSHPRILLDQQNRGVAADFRDDPEYRLHD